MKNYALTLIALIVTISSIAQDKWDLKRCVDFAVKNNVSVRQADVQARITALQLKQAKYAKIPSVSFSPNIGFQFGRSIDPTTNQFTTTQLLYQGMALQGGLQIFGFGQVKQNIHANEYNTQAAFTDVERNANDVSLTVANYYLQILSAKEQINIAEVQVSQTKSQYDITKKKVDAGALPELNLAELESQLATDSSNLITSKANFDLSILTLKGALNLDAAIPFEVDTPPVDKIPIEPIADLAPDAVFGMAINNQPLQKANALRIKGAESTIKAHKATLYPSFYLGYNLASNFSNPTKSVDYNSVTVIGKTPTSYFVDVNGANYNVFQPQVQYDQIRRSFFTLWDGYWSQMDQNFRQAVGLTMTVPIFNNTGSYRINYQRSQLDLQNLKIQQQGADLKLKNDIYTAYTNATGSMQKYFMGFKTVETAQKAYDYATKRYEVGLLSTIDLITNQNNLLRAKLQQLNNQYDYVFKMKLLEFYKGQGIRLE